MKMFCLKKEANFMHIHFYKYQGTGNDFVILDNRNSRWEKILTTSQIAFLCDRRFGIGADGLILLSDSEEHDFKMIYYNSDGRESSMCGNGGRCIVAFAYQLGAIGPQCSFEAIDGLHEAQISGKEVKLKMGKPQGYQPLAEHTVWLDTGSPHYVRFQEEAVSQLDVDQEGREIRNSEAYRAEGTNVNFVNVLGEAQLQVRTYERGVEAETLSCGTGVTACAYAYHQSNPATSGTIQVKTEGGNLSVEIQNFQQHDEAVFLIGPATFVYEGDIAVPEA